jgi:hypothetical protein
MGVTATLAAASFAQDVPSGRKLDIPVPIGHEVKGLHLPVRNNEGKMDMLFDIETATRLDAILNGRLILASVSLILWGSGIV